MEYTTRDPAFNPPTAQPKQLIATPSELNQPSPGRLIDRAMRSSGASVWSRASAR